MITLRLSQVFFLFLLLPLIASGLPACPQDYTDEINYTNAKERFVVSLKGSEPNLISAHYGYLRDCMNRVLIYSSEHQYYDIINGTKISDNQNVIYIINTFNIYFGWFDPSYVNDKLSKMGVIASAEKDQEVHTN